MEGNLFAGLEELGPLERALLVLLAAAADKAGVVVQDIVAAVEEERVRDLLLLAAQAVVLLHILAVAAVLDTELLQPEVLDLLWVRGVERTFQGMAVLLMAAVPAAEEEDRMEMLR